MATNLNYSSMRWCAARKTKNTTNLRHPLPPSHPFIASNTSPRPPPRPPSLPRPRSKGMGPRGAMSGTNRVSFASDAMLAAIFRVALKAFGERARLLTLPGPGFRQVQLDADFLRQVNARFDKSITDGGNRRRVSFFCFFCLFVLLLDFYLA